MSIKYIFFYILFAVTSLAATWTGSLSSNVSTGGNWQDNTSPNMNSTLGFENVANTTVYFNWPTATNRIQGMNFNSNSASYTFNGSNGTDLRLGYINNDAVSSTQTFNIDLQFENNSNVRTHGTIVFNDDISVLGSGKLNFDGNGLFVFGEDDIFASNIELTLMNGIDLNLGSTTQSFEKLSITGNSIIDFSDGGSLELDSLFIQDGGKLFVLNWSEDSFFSVDNTVTQTTLNRIEFLGFDGASWSSYDDHVKPHPVVPEASTYGAFLVGSAAVLFWLRRSKKRA